MRVTITGAGGFIASHLVPRLLARGDDLTALVRSEADATLLESQGARVVRGDVRDLASVERAAADAQVIYHLARARGHGARPMAEVRAVNAEGTLNVARAAVRAGAQRIVHASSATIYGSRTGSRPVSEDAALKPYSPYARSKTMAERALEATGEVSVVVARITAVLGAGSKNWASFIRSVQSNTLRLIGDGSNWHHPADVSDVADGLMLCGDVDGISGRVYNLAGPEPMRIRDMVRLMREELNVEVPPPRNVPKLIGDGYYYLDRVTDGLVGMRLPRIDGVLFLSGDRILDLTRAKAELGYAPKVSVGEALRRTIAWHRSEGMIRDLRLRVSLSDDDD